MKKIILLILFIYSLNFAQNFFPYQVGDTLFYKQYYYNTGTEETRYITKAITESILIDGNTYVKFNNAYYFQDSSNNRLLLRPDPGSSDEYIFNYDSEVNDEFEFYGSYSYQTFKLLNKQHVYIANDNRQGRKLYFYSSSGSASDYLEQRSYSETFVDSIGIFNQSHTFSSEGIYGYISSRRTYDLEQFKIGNKEHVFNYISIITPPNFIPDTLNIATLDSLYFSFATSTNDTVLLKKKYVEAVHRKSDGTIIDTTFIDQEFTNNYASIPIYDSYSEGDIIQVALKCKDLGLAPPVRLPETGYFNITLIDSVYTSMDDAGFTPLKYDLVQNYPNPFNPSTKITYSVAKPGNVKLVVYNSLGQQVKELVNEYKNMGTYLTEFTAEGLPSGMYFYTIASGSFTKTKKMILLK